MCSERKVLLVGWLPVAVLLNTRENVFLICSLGLSATSQQYFSLTTNQPPATSQQYSSLRTNQHQQPATSQVNTAMVRFLMYVCKRKKKNSKDV
jgi:hypothetical protein